MGSKPHLMDRTEDVDVTCGFSFSSVEGSEVCDDGDVDGDVVEAIDVTPRPGRRSKGSGRGGGGAGGAGERLESSGGGGDRREGGGSPVREGGLAGSVGFGEMVGLGGTSEET